MGSFQQYYEVGPLRDYSSSTIAWIPSLQLFFPFGLGPIVGILFDNYGPRPLIIGGTLFHVFGLMMASLATKYYQFLLAQGVCSAMGVAFLYSPGESWLAWQLLRKFLMLTETCFVVKRSCAFPPGSLRSVEQLWVSW